MKDDYFTQTEQIIDALESEGLLTEAEEVRDALEGGSSSTEILIGVYSSLNQIDRANRATNVETKPASVRVVAALAETAEPYELIT